MTCDVTNCSNELTLKTGMSGSMSVTMVRTAGTISRGSRLVRARNPYPHLGTVRCQGRLVAQAVPQPFPGKRPPAPP